MIVARSESGLYLPISVVNIRKLTVKFFFIFFFTDEKVRGKRNLQANLSVCVSFEREGARRRMKYKDLIYLFFIRKFESLI